MLRNNDYEAARDIFDDQNDIDGPRMFVMTNRDGINGAAGIVINEKLVELADQMGSDLYILPSSIHELIILSQKETGENAEKLTEMVKEVNETKVSEEDFLSDNVYEFTRENRIIRNALTGEELELKVS